MSETKTLIIFYSYSGHSKALAEALAKENSFDIAEIKDASRPSGLKAFFVGCFAALRGKSWPIAPIDFDFSGFPGIVLMSPVWAGNAPPAVNALLEILPEGKTVSVKMVSGSGKSECRARLEAVIKDRGCTLDTFEDIKA